MVLQNNEIDVILDLVSSKLITQKRLIIFATLNISMSFN